MQKLENYHDFQLYDLLGNLKRINWKIMSNVNRIHLGAGTNLTPINSIVLPHTKIYLENRSKYPV